MAMRCFCPPLRRMPRSPTSAPIGKGLDEPAAPTKGFERSRSHRVGSGAALRVLELQIAYFKVK